MEQLLLKYGAGLRPANYFSLAYDSCPWATSGAVECGLEVPQLLNLKNNAQLEVNFRCPVLKP